MNASDLFRLDGRLAFVARGDLREVTSQIERTGRRAIAIAEDLADRSAPERILDRAGNADILGTVLAVDGGWLSR